MKFSMSGVTAVGGRDCNEDSIFIRGNRKRALAVVADGLGGHGGGDAASSAAVGVAAKHLQKMRTVTSDDMRAAVSQANDAAALCAGAKTTIAVLYIDEAGALAAHAGDTRIYQFRGGEIIAQSLDHSVSQMAVSVGEITQDEIRHHIDRNKLLRALGASETVNADIRELPARKGDAFLLCTDGFWELVLENEMMESLQAAKNARQWLKKMLVTVKKKITETGDNYSAVAIMLS